MKSEHQIPIVAIVAIIGIIIMINYGIPSGPFSLVTGEGHRPTSLPHDDPPPNPLGNVDVTTSRNTGVGPLSVHFDILESFTWDEIEELDFQWDFRDGTTYNGYLAAHTFEPRDFPYRVRLRVTDSDGHILAKESIQIIATDPDDFYSETTYCFSNNEDFTGCPQGGAHITAAPNEYSNITDQIGSNRRILLKTGDDWEAETHNLEDLENFYMGSFGEGEKPKLVINGNALSNLFKIYDNVNNIIFENLYFEGSEWILTSCGDECGERFGTGNIFSIRSESGTKDILFKDIDIFQLTGFLVGESGSTADNILLDNINLNKNGAWLVYCPIVKNIAVIDSSVSDIQNEHGFRCNAGSNILINNVNFDDIDGSYVTIRGESQHGLVSDSSFIGDGLKMVLRQVSGNGEWGSLNDDVKNIMYERNFFDGGTAGFFTLGRWIIFRNNIIVDAEGIELSSEGTPTEGGPPGHVKIYHNSQYEAGTTRFIKFASGSLEQGGVYDIEIKNNLYYGTGAYDGCDGCVDNSPYDIKTTSDLNYMKENLNIDYNIYFDYNDEPGDRFIALLHPDKSFEDWQAEGFDQNSFYEIPNYIDPPNNLRLNNGATGINYGPYLTYRDIDRIIRPVGGGVADLGAYENS